ncbi:MAG TPA: group II intron maturase-specific domain-containing protein [Rhodothermales bacterium]|nr:group II intron maturase-specific domain-containing protein [Rhodothermales bacterium]
MDERIGKLMQVTRGWVNYFAHADAQKRLSRIAEWTQARLRMCIWKQWKRVRTRIAALRKLGSVNKNPMNGAIPAKNIGASPTAKSQVVKILH